MAYQREDVIVDPYPSFSSRQVVLYRSTNADCGAYANAVGWVLHGRAVSAKHLHVAA